MPLLDEQDARALQKAALENKLPLLYMIADDTMHRWKRVGIMPSRFYLFKLEREEKWKA